MSALVARAASVQIDCALRDLPRISSVLTRDDGSVAGRFRFYRLAATEPVARGCDAAECMVRAVLPLTCQRCLGEVDISVEARADLAFVDEEADREAVPESHDPVIMTAGRVSLAALIEEELLLAMPIVPVHADPKQCQLQPPPHSDADEPDARAAARTHTPFAGLRELMKK